MANHIIKDPKVLDLDLRQLELTDPVHKDVLNPLYAILINNDAYLKEYVDTCIENLVGGSVEALDTLKELGEALGNDPNMATTLTELITTKVEDLAGAGRTTETVKGISDLLNTLKNTVDGHIADTHIHPKIEKVKGDIAEGDMEEGTIYLLY